MKRFVRILLVALLMLLAFSAGFVLSQAEAQAHSAVEAPQNLVVVDANNKVVGTLLGVSPWDGESIIVALRILPQKRVTRLLIKRDDYSNTANPLIGFESNDCSGQPYLIYFEFGQLFDPSAIGTPGNTLYVAQPGAVPQERFINSTLNDDDPEHYPLGCREEWWYNTSTLPATAVVDLDTVFTRPFHFRHSGKAK